MTTRPVRLTTVENELEARLLCDALRSAGVRCNFAGRPNELVAYGGQAITGPVEIFVDEHDLDRAREVLAAAEEEGRRARLEPLPAEDYPEESHAGTAASVVFWVMMALVAVPLIAFLIAIALAFH